MSSVQPRDAWHIAGAVIAELSLLTLCPGYKSLLAMVMASMLWLVTTHVDIEILQTIGLLLLQLSIVWALLYIQVTKILVLPVLCSAITIK